MRYLPFAILVLGCDGVSEVNPGEGEFGTQTGEDPVEGDDCTEGEVTVTELSEATPLGFSGTDLLAFAGGTHEATLTWADGAVAGLTIVLAATEGAGVETFVPTASDCGSTVAVGVTVSFASDDGQFAEMVDGTLVSDDSESARITLRLAELDGALGDSLESDQSVTINADFDGSGTHGQIALVTEGIDVEGDVSSSEEGALATW